VQPAVGTRRLDVGPSRVQPTRVSGTQLLPGLRVHVPDGHRHDTPDAPATAADVVAIGGRQTPVLGTARHDRWSAAAVVRRAGLRDEVSGCQSQQLGTTDDGRRGRWRRRRRWRWRR